MNLLCIKSLFPFINKGEIFSIEAQRMELITGRSPSSEDWLRGWGCGNQRVSITTEYLFKNLVNDKRFYLWHLENLVGKNWINYFSEID